MAFRTFMRSEDSLDRDAARLAADPRPSSCAFVAGLVLVAFGIIPVLFALSVSVGRLSLTWELSPQPDNINHYFGARPTVPISCHSHNDYWRATPLQSAMLTGCISVEADVWAYQDELYVAHDRGGMKPNHTLSSMYLDPIHAILAEKTRVNGKKSCQGLYDSAPEQTLVMLVDFKANAPETWRLLLEKLEPLRKQGWLSRIINAKLSLGAITVVVTGGVPFNLIIEANPTQDIFFDAPLAKLSDGAYNATNSYYASVSFRESIGSIGSSGMSESQLRILRKQIQQAHDRGIKVRYWSLPAWPIHKRNRLWGVLLDEGVDVLNVDDLESAKAAPYQS